MKEKNDLCEVYSSTSLPGVKALLLIVEKKYISGNIQLLPLKIAPLKLWIGSDSRIKMDQSFFINIPMRFRPSPLNLIFKNLSGAGWKLDIDNIRFNTIDFDAY